MFYPVFRNHCTLRLNIYLLKMSCGKRRKWHFWAPKYENVLGEHAPTPPSLHYLRRSNLSFPAYTFKTLSYAIEVSLSFSRSNVFWLLINREQELSAFCNSADLHCLLIFFFRRISYRVYYFFFPPRHTFLSEEEYMMQGTEETRRALEDLREYCSSPECDTWRLVSRLQSPTRYVTIPVEGFSLWWP